jgi:hypothetical protein
MCTFALKAVYFLCWFIVKIVYACLKSTIRVTCRIITVRDLFTLTMLVEDSILRNSFCIICFITCCFHILRYKYYPRHFFPSTLPAISFCRSLSDLIPIKERTAVQCQRTFLFKMFMITDLKAQSFCPPYLETKHALRERPKQ